METLRSVPSACLRPQSGLVVLDEQQFTAKLRRATRKAPPAEWPLATEIKPVLVRPPFDEFVRTLQAQKREAPSTASHATSVRSNKGPVVCVDVDEVDPSPIHRRSKRPRDDNNHPSSAQNISNILHGR